MKNTWLVWLFIVGVVITVLVAFNYQGDKETVPLSEIFPEEETVPVDIEYEFVDETQQKKAEGVTTAQTQEAKKQTTQAAQAETEAKTEEVATTSDSTTAAAVKDISDQQISFTIQVASFKSEEMAQSSLKKVTEQGYEAFVVSKDLGEKGTWHRIYIGTFQTKPQADEYLTKVKEDYPSSFIISPK